MSTTTRKPSNSSGVVLWPLNGSQTTSRQAKSAQKSGRRPYQRRPTAGRRGNGKSSGKGSRGPHRNRRDEVLRRLDVDPQVLATSPQITPLLRQNGIKNERLVEVLRCDITPEASRFVQLWDKLTPASRSLAGVEAIALGAGMTPRRLWEVFCGAALVQGKESVGISIALSLPEVMQMTVKEAKKSKGHLAREHLFKAARVLPTPKGSTTVINVGEPIKELEDGEDDGPDETGMLEPADDQLMKFSRAMNPKALPAQVPVIEAEEAEEEDEEEE